jgi:hypothetical protein
MPPNSQTGRLLLAPDSPERTPPAAPLLAYLRETGFVGRPLDHEQADAFLVGSRFLQLITFMGCSPHIELEPPADCGPFCHVQVIGPLPEPQLMRGENTQPPRCGQCRGRLSHWQKEVAGWCAHPERADVLCPRCGYRQRPVELGWRRNAGFGRLFVAVEDIFPGEAVPVPSFLQGLERASGVVWDYFYIRDVSASQ